MSALHKLFGNPIPNIENLHPKDVFDIMQLRILKAAVDGAIKVNEEIIEPTLKEFLDDLDKKSSQGEWKHEFKDGVSCGGEIAINEELSFIVVGANYGKYRNDVGDGGESEFKANGDFVVELVKAYRQKRIVVIPEYKEAIMNIAEAIQEEARSGSNDTPADYGDAEGLARIAYKVFFPEKSKI